MGNHDASPKEGQLYKAVTVAGRTFELRYGYYEDHERKKGPPVVIYPDFLVNPVYTDQGFPYVTLIQAPCRYYAPVQEADREDWCCDCRHYHVFGDEVGICRCVNRMRSGGQELLPDAKEPAILKE